MMWLVLLLFNFLFVSGSDVPLTEDLEGQWRNCHIFLAPSPHNLGWGVFAARDFAEGEMVEIAPLVVPFRHSHPILQHSVLDDYVYAWERRALEHPSDEEEYESVSGVCWGMSMYYNHHEDQNVRWIFLGSEPDDLGEEDDDDDEDLSESMFAVGFEAIQDIKAGSELFSSYGDEQWFADRRIDLQLPTENTAISSDQLESFKSQYCSKAFAGLDFYTYYNRMKSFDIPNLSFWDDMAKLLPSLTKPNDSLLGFSTMAKVPISAGERILIAPGLLLNNRYVKDSALAPLVFTWNDLDDTNQQVMKNLKEEGHIRLQYQGLDTDWARIDRFKKFDDLAIVSEAGMVERVGLENHDESNCRLQISASGSRNDSAGILLELIATKNIETGHAIKLNLPAYSSEHERGLLKEELQRMGFVRFEQTRDSEREEF